MGKRLAGSLAGQGLIPRGIISERDPPFSLGFWKGGFQRLNTKLPTSTAYHPQTDGQSERTNQPVEIALRYFLTTNTESEWVEYCRIFRHQ